MAGYEAVVLAVRLLDTHVLLVLNVAWCPMDASLYVKYEIPKQTTPKVIYYDS